MGTSSALIGTWAFTFLLLNIVAFIWFNTHLPSAWSYIDESNLNSFNFKTAPPPSSDTASLSAYAGIAAVTHSLALICGQVLCALSSRYSLPKQLGATLSAITVSFFLLKSFFHSSFDAKEGLVYEQASMFFYDKPNSSSFFAIFSSCSYTLWLLAGYAVRSTSKSHVGIFPQVLQKNILKLVSMLMASYLTLYCLVFPLWYRLMKPMMVAENQSPALDESHFLEFSAIATLSHTVAIALGLFFAKQAPNIGKVQSLVSSINRRSPHHAILAIATHPLLVSTLVVFLVLSALVPNFASIACWMAINFFDYLCARFTSFAIAVEGLVSGGSIFSATVMAIFYFGLISVGVCVNSMWYSVADEMAAAKSIGPGSGFKVTGALIQKSREMSYQNVETKSGGAEGMIHTLLWLSCLSFFGSPPGVFCLYGILHICSGLKTPDVVVDGPLKTFFLSTLITAWGSIITFVPFARMWDNMYEKYPELRCQQDKAHNVTGLFRKEVYLAVMNLFQAAALSSAVAVIHLCYPGTDKIYFENPFASLAGVAYLLGSVVVFFLWIDAWAYIAHRLLHLPWMYKNIHKVHHTWKQTTAFTALALHPCEFMLITGGVYVALYVFPLHPAAITVNLLYIHYHNVVDHSGVYCESNLKWQPSSLYHDDHHRHFHVNYGQSLVVWDQFGGTFWDATGASKYGEKNFSF